MTERPAPRAMPGRRETHIRAMAAVLGAASDWWALTEAEAVAAGMAATHGAADPREIAREFKALREERGFPDT